ncbi:MAG: hypothetical protein ACI9V8_001463 [Urechidicola sp.]
MLEIGGLSLFWKKKKTTSLGLDSNGDDRRQAFRIVPNAEKPILITIKGQAYKAVNISGAGVCIRAYNLPVGTVASAIMRLPSENFILSMTIEVIVKKGSFCRCRFNQVGRQAENLLHAYILDLQKVKIRRNNSH